MDSVDHEEAGLCLYGQLSNLWSKAGMHARKWASNSINIMEQVSMEDCVKEVDLTKSDIPTVKALGVIWEAPEDVFKFCLKVPTMEIVTKCKFLKIMASLYDPLGFVTPFTVKGKMLLQEMWLINADWDGGQPERIQLKANEWFTEISQLSNVSVPRCLVRYGTTVITASIHIFFAMRLNWHIPEVCV